MQNLRVILSLLVFTMIAPRVVGQATNKLDTVGNVGIGTLTPLYKFVVKTPYATGNMLGAFTNSNSEGIYFFHTGSDNSDYATKANTNVLSSDYQSSASYRDLGFATSGQVRMTVATDGYIGIGTTSPAASLDVNGSVYVRGASMAANTIEQFSGSTLTLQGGGGSGAILFNSGGAYERMRITDAGYLGLGTTSPSEKLTVEGNIAANGVIRAKKVTVTQLGWSDHVFNDDYKLRTLSSLESFIKRNNRLPDVPSAKEVEENGISVGDNQALLLKKIEELTLYVIDLQRQVNSLKTSQSRPKK